MLHNFLFIVVCASSASAAEYVWETVDRGTLPNEEPGDRPHVRYGSSMSYIEGGIVMAHGYHFHHHSSAAVWLGDHWKYDLTSEKWEFLRWHHKSTRYKHTLSTTANDKVIMIGGDDGGHRYSQSHVWGAFTPEVFEVYPEVVSLGSFSEAKRQGHTSVVFGNKIIIFGGIITGEESSKDSTHLSDSSDLFLYDVDTNSWEKISSSLAPLWPLGRRSHTANIIGNTMYVFGGFSRHTAEKNFDDFWSLDVQKLVESKQPVWRKISKGPSPRGGHVAVSDSKLGILWIHGGALCKQGCKCLGDLWEYNSNLGSWREITISRGMRPVARHFHMAVLDPVRHVMYITGGESYAPYSYWNDVWRISLTGAVPNEKLVDNALVYEGIPGGIKSLMGNERTTREELELIRAPEYREHDRLIKSGQLQEAKVLHSSDGSPALTTFLFLFSCFFIIVYTVRINTPHKKTW